MKKFIVIEDNTIVNKIVADSLETAKEVSGLHCVEEPEGIDLEVGYEYDSTKEIFLSTKPFDSWIWNYFSKEWEAPYIKPADQKEYAWDEGSMSWVEATLVEPESE